jgi:hypothetical protein
MSSDAQKLRLKWLLPGKAASGDGGVSRHYPPDIVLDLFDRMCYKQAMDEARGDKRRVPVC